METQQIIHKIGDAHTHDETLFSLLYEVLENQQSLIYDNKLLKEQLEKATAKIEELNENMGVVQSELGNVISLL